MKIIDVEVIPIHPGIAARNADQLVRFREIDRRTVFKVETDNGLVGYGDLRCPAPPRSSFEHLIDRNPFDFMHSGLHVGLAGALYDVMGKYLEVPAYKLMGQKVRDRVPVAAWTRPASPEDLSKEVRRAVDQGYMLFKMHTCQYYDVLAQNRAVEEVAPPGFKMHYDFNHNRTLGAVLPLFVELAQSRVVGYIEDPLPWADIDGWRRLRAQANVPLVMHVPALGGLQEVMHGMADAYMVGEHDGGVGEALMRGFAYGKANVQAVIQLTGGTLTKALAMHIAAVLPTAAHSINLDDQYAADVTRQRIEVVEGCSPVPEGPGLGVEVDGTALARLAAGTPTEIPKHVGVLSLPGGHKLYTPSIPDVSRLTGFAEGTIRGVDFCVWHDDGSEAFARAYERVQREGAFIEEQAGRGVQGEAPDIN